jgi:hypothetical protein
MSDDSNNTSSGQPAFPQGPTAFSASTSSWLPPRLQAIGRGAEAINQGAQAVGRGVAGGLMAIDKASHEIGGPKPAY